jgi:hypothetical protein
MYYLLVLVAAASRIMPHPPNMAPIAALGLFAGAYSQRRSSWAIPLAGLLLADAFIGFYNPIVMALVYAGFVASGLLGKLFLKDKRSPARIGAVSIAGSVAFFLLSNFGVWAAGMYPRTMSGLIQCYVMGIQSFWNTLVGDLFYSAVLFGLHEASFFYAARKTKMEAITG